MKKILIAETDVTTKRMLKKYLGELGYHLQFITELQNPLNFSLYSLLIINVSIYTKNEPMKNTTTPTIVLTTADVHSAIKLTNLSQKIKWLIKPFKKEELLRLIECLSV